jgi:hypothetical protein
MELRLSLGRLFGPKERAGDADETQSYRLILASDADRFTRVMQVPGCDE